MIRVRNLSVHYGALSVLQDIDLDVGRGECVLITGPSGCGKSTLAYVLCGLIPHAIPAEIEGRIEVASLDIQTCPVSEIAQKAGIVFQRPSSQLFHLRVEDEVAFGPRNLGLDEDELRRRTDWALRATGLLALRERKPAELSGGQKQCLSIAAVLAMRPAVLVLDEPTASLDVPSTRRVMETLATLRAEYGITIVLIEHRLVEAAQLADRVILMEAGRIIADGSPAVIFSDRKARERLGLRRPADVAPVSWESLIKTDGYPSNGRVPLLSLEHVSAGYNHHAVIEQIDLKLFPGDFVALVGDNGAGKSTLGLVAAGLLKPQRGKVCFLNGTRPRPGLDVAMLFQDPAEQLFTDTVDEEVAFAPQNYARFEPACHEQILREADLLEMRDRRPATLSVGQQQRTTLGACVSLRPRLLILDEPTLGQDWGHLQRLMDYLLALNRQGTAILLISHDYKLVHRYARRVLLMKNGSILLEGYISRTGNSGLTPDDPRKALDSLHDVSQAR